MSDAKLPPLPWSSMALRQPWPDSAADPYRIRDADGQLVLRRNWKDVCLAIAHMVRSANEIDALRADLAAANATIAAQSLALATMREACLEDHTEDHLYLGGYLCRLCGHDVAPDVPEEHAKSCVFYSDGDQPASDAAAMAVAVLAAADQMTEMMALMLGEEDEPDGDGGDVLIRMARARSAYRRARAALRVHGAVEHESDGALS